MKSILPQKDSALTCHTKYTALMASFLYVLFFAVAAMFLSVLCPAPSLRPASSEYLLCKNTQMSGAADVPVAQHSKAGKPARDQ